MRVALVTGCWISLAFTALAEDSKAVLERARALQQAGKLSEARSLYQGLLSAPDQKLEGEVRLELSRIDVSEGRYSDALTEGTKSATLARSLHNRSLEGNAVTMIGLARMYSGEYASAANDFTEALTAARETQDGAAEVTRLNNLGNVFFYEGRYADAMQRYRQALKVVESHAGESWNPARRQLTVANIATLYQRLGQYRNALDTYNAMRATPSALPVAERAQLLANMGALYRRLGDPIKALETYHAAQALYQESRMRNGEITVLNNMGIAQALDLHALKEALGTFDEALRMAQSSGSKPLELQSWLYRGETLFRLKRYAEAEQDFHSASALADSVHAPEDKWKALYGLARVARTRDDPASGKLLREALAVIETIRSNVGGTAPRNGFLADKRQVYDLLIDLQIRAANPDARDLFRLMEQSRARSLKDRKGTPSAGDLDTIRKSLDAQTMLVEYWIGEDSLAAVWVSASGSGVYARTDVTSLRRDLSALAGELPKASSRDPQLMDRVADILVGGVKPQLTSGEIRALVVVPDREIARVPFEVFPLAPGKPERVLDRVSVAYLPTASFLRPAAKKRQIVPFWSRVLLAFADPAPGDIKGESDLPSPVQPIRLPGAAAEVREIGELLSGKHEEHFGPDARKAYLNHAPEYSILHFATHAWIDPEDANRSYILFAPAHATQFYDYFFLKEAAGLDLGRVDLITASACETQNGEFVEGEGVENFSQAFLASGARSVVTSLWKVSDQATARLMRNFYSELADGKDAGESLRQAKLQYSRSAKEGKDFSYWAAFVLSGDTHMRLPFVVSWTIALAALLAMAGIGLLLLSYLREWTRRTPTLRPRKATRLS